MDELESEEARQQGHDHVRGQVDASARDDRQRRQQDQAGGEGRDHDVELGGVQGERDPCVVHATGGEDPTEQSAAQPDVEALHQVAPQFPAKRVAEQPELDLPPAGAATPATPPRTRGRTTHTAASH